MDYKKTKAPLTTVTRDVKELDGTSNIYQTVMVASKRANQISVEMKHELNRKLEEFASYTDNLEEVFENPEQTTFKTTEQTYRTSIERDLKLNY